MMILCTAKIFGPLLKRKVYYTEHCALWGGIIFLTCEPTALSEQAGLWNRDGNEELNFKEAFSVITTTFLNYY